MSELLYTATGTPIMDRIQKGKTFFFKDQLAAQKKAKEIGTYPYQVFDSKNKHVGYAVPK